MINFKFKAHPAVRVIVFLLCVCCLLLDSQYAFASKQKIKVSIHAPKLNSSQVSVIKTNLNINTYTKYALQSEQHLRVLLGEDLVIIKNKLRQFGFYTASVKYKLVLQSDKVWQVTFLVYPGVKVSFKRVSIVLEGAGRDNKKLRSFVKTQHGLLKQYFTYERYEEIKTGLQELAIQIGYLDAKFTKHIAYINRNTHKACIDLTLNTGELYSFGSINIQRKILSDEFVKRLIFFRKNETYSSRLLLKSQSDLSKTIYFSSVNFIPSPNRKTHKVPVTIVLKENKRQQYTIGVGYGPATRFRGSFGWVLRYFNKSGHHIKFNVSASKIYLRYGLAYIIPGENPLTDHWSIKAQQETDKVETYKADVIALGISKAWQVPHWKISLGVWKKYISYDLRDNNVRHQNYLMPVARFLYGHYQPLAYWNQGLTIDFSIFAAAKGVSSDNSFVQGIATFRYSLGLTHRTRLYARITTGVLETSDFNSLAPSFRFYAGGPESVRGYIFKSLGPTDGSGKVVGGRYLFVSSLNYEIHLKGKWSGFLFFDFGNAFNKFPIKLQKSTGLGVSWRSPVGAISAYIAHTLTSHVRNTTSFNFTIGSFLR